MPSSKTSVMAAIIADIILDSWAIHKTGKSMRVAVEEACRDAGQSDLADLLYTLMTGNAPTAVQWALLRDVNIT